MANFRTITSSEETAAIFQAFSIRLISLSQFLYSCARKRLKEVLNG